MRKDGALYYLIGDHLGSTSLVTDAAGTVVSETRYKAWGEVRYQSGVTPTEYQFTSQYSYAADFGLLFYNARFYDPSLSRFISADTIVPPGVQGLDRYAYTFNNPLRYTDPTGHDPWWCEGDDLCMFNWMEDHTSQGGDGYFAEYEITVDPKMNKEERRTIFGAAYATGKKITETRNQGESASEAFKEIFEPITFTKSDVDYEGCVFQTQNAISCSNFTNYDFQSNVNNVVHELAHVFNQLNGGSPNDFGLKYVLRRDWILRPDTGGIKWQQHPPSPGDPDHSGGEMLGDMFVAWVFDAWNTHPLNVDEAMIARDDMNDNMNVWLNK